MAGCVGSGVCGDVWWFWAGWDCRSMENCLVWRLVGRLWRSAGVCHVRPVGCLWRSAGMCHGRPVGCLWGSRGGRWGRWCSFWGDSSGNLVCWCRRCAVGGGYTSRQAAIFRCKIRTGCLCSCWFFCRYLFSCRGSGEANSMKKKRRRTRTHTWPDAERVCWFLQRR